MRNGDPRADAQRLLDETLELLDESRQADMIDAPLDKAASTFRFNPTNGDTADHDILLDVLTEYIAHIYRHGLSMPQHLNATQARAEAIHLLEGAYEGPYGHGYDAALLELEEYAESALHRILLYLLEVIKATEREKHFRWVITTRIGQASWDVQRNMVDLLRSEYGEDMPNDLNALPCEQLVYLLPVLLRNLLTARSEIARVVSRNTTRR